MQAYGLSPDYSDQNPGIGVWLKPFFRLLCLDSEEFAFDIIPKAPKTAKQAPLRTETGHCQEVTGRECV